MPEHEMSFEQQSYEVDDLWVKLDASERDLDRVNCIARQIPKGVKSILDVGCGNGIFLKHLQENGYQFDRLCGVDRSEAALKHVTTEKRLVDIVRLPYRDGEFDLAVCLEVLEHLPGHIYSKSLDEISRVASRHVLLCVPYKEDLALAHVTCPECTTRFSADYHLRSFDQETFQTVLSPFGFEMKELFFIGDVVDHYIGLRWYTKLTSLTSRYSWYAICPACGYRETLAFKPHATPTKSSWRTRVKQFWPKKRKSRWIGGLFERQTCRGTKQLRAAG